MSPYVDHIVLCGYGPGTTMLLESMGTEFDLDLTTVVVIGDGDRPRTLTPEFHWISGDPTKESELGKVRVRYAAAVVIVGSRQVPPSLADANTILGAVGNLDVRVAGLDAIAEALAAEGSEGQTGQGLLAALRSVAKRGGGGGGPPSEDFRFELARNGALNVNGVPLDEIIAKGSAGAAQ